MASLDSQSQLLALRARGDFKGVHEMRKSLCGLYLSDKGFWEGWTDDVLDSKDRSAIDDLFSRLLLDYADEGLILRLLDHYIALLEEEAMDAGELREKFDACLHKCGQDILTGHKFWERRLEFEVEEHQDAVDQGTIVGKDLLESKKRCINLMHRQLTLPLLFNQTALAKFESILGDLCEESDFSIVQPTAMADKLAASNAMLKKRLPFEEKLSLSDKHAHSDVAQRVVDWQSYIDFELKEKQLPRVERLFERAVIACADGSLNNDNDDNNNNNIGISSGGRSNGCDMHLQRLWIEYVQFSLCTLKNWALTASISKRATMVVPSCLPIWQIRFLSVEKSAGLHKKQQQNHVQEVLSSGDADRNKMIAAEEIVSEMQRAFSHGAFSQAEEYLEILLQYCHFHVRALQQVMQLNATSMSADTTDNNRNNNSGSNVSTMSSREHALLLRERIAASDRVVLKAIEDGVVAMRAAFAYAESVIQAYYPAWVEGFWRLYSVWANAEQTCTRIAYQTYCTAFPTPTSTSTSTSTLLTSSAAVVVAGNQESTGEGEKQFSLAETGLRDAIQRFPGNEDTFFGAQIWNRAMERFPTDLSIWQASITWGTQVRALEYTRKLYRSLFNKAKIRSTSLHRHLAQVTRDWMSFEGLYGLGIRENNNSNNNSGCGMMMISNIELMFPAIKESAEERAEQLRQMERERVLQEAQREEERTGKAAEKVQRKAQKAQTVTQNTLNGEATVEKKEEVQPSRKRVRIEDPRDAADASTLDPDNTDTGACTSAGCGFGSEGNILENGFLNTKRTDEVVVAAASSEDSSAAEKIKKAKGKKGEGKSGDGIGGGSKRAPYTTTVFISNLSRDVVDADLTERFGRCGDVLAARVARDKKTKESKRTGLVQFTSEAARDAALQQCNNTELMGQIIRVVPSRFSLVQDNSTSSSSSSSSSKPSSSFSFSTSTSTAAATAPVADVVAESNTDPSKGESAVSGGGSVPSTAPSSGSLSSPVASGKINDNNNNNNNNNNITNPTGTESEQRGYYGPASAPMKRAAPVGNPLMFRPRGVVKKTRINLD